MASSKSTKGVSLSSRAFTRGVGLGPGPAKVTAAEFGMYKYASGKRFPALLLTVERGGEDQEPEPYTLGSGWDVSRDGQALIPKGGQTGIPDSCKLAHLIRSLEACDMPNDYFTKPEDLIGIEGEMILKELPRFDSDRGKGGKDGKGEDRQRSVLVFDSVEESPWEQGSKKSKGKSKSKAKDEDEDEEEEEEKEDEDEEEEDEKPAKSKRRAKKDDDEEDEDEAEPEGDADDVDEETKEQATEALIEALEAGPIRASKIEGAVLGVLGKAKGAKATAAYAATEACLEQELGWTFDGKTVALGKKSKKR